MEVTFVPFDLEALEKSYDWLRDYEIQRLTMTPKITRESQQTWFVSLAERRDYMVRAVKWENRLVGVVGLKHIDMENKKAEYFGYIGEKEMWGRGIGKKMVGYILIYAKEAGLKEVYLHVAEDNERAIQLYQKMGFEMIGKREDVLKMKMNC